MTDTRKKSNRVDYDLEQNLSFMHYEYQNKYGAPEQSYFPGNGLIGQRVSRVHLANNSCDVESMLRGIGSANMVRPMAPIVPDIRTVKTLDLFETQQLQMPEPLVVRRGERPAW